MNVRITGVVKPDQEVRAVVDAQVNNASYQWYLGTKAIDGATAQSYKITSADLAKNLSVRVSYLDSTTGLTRNDVSTGRMVTQEQILTDTNRDGRSDLIFQGNDGSVIAMPLSEKGASMEINKTLYDSTISDSWVLVDSAVRTGEGRDALLFLDTAQRSVYQTVLNTDQSINTLQSGYLKAVAYPTEFDTVSERTAVHSVSMANGEQLQVTPDLRLIASGIDFNANSNTTDLLWADYSAYRDVNGNDRSVDSGLQGRLFVTTQKGGVTVTAQLPQVNLHANGVDYQVKAVADYDGNGTSDILLQGSDRTLMVVELKGTVIDKQGLLSNAMFSGTAHTQIPSRFEIVDARADVNNDGRTDILFRNINTGALLVDKVVTQGVGLTQEQVVPTNTKSSLGVAVPANAEIISAHNDFNGDGMTDVLYRTSDGSTRISLIDGIQGIILKTVDLNGLTGWEARNADHDVNNDGRSDIVWTHSTNGVVDNQYMMVVDASQANPVVADAGAIVNVPDAHIEQVQLVGLNAPELVAGYVIA